MVNYRDEKWLREQHVECGKSISEIARESGVSRNAVSRWVNRYGVKMVAPLYTDRDWLHREDITKGRTYESLASECGVSTQTININVKRHGLQRVNILPLEVELTCPICKAEFKRRRKDYDSAIKAGRKNFFCSSACLKVFRRGHIAGTLNPYHKVDTKRRKEISKKA